VQAEVKRKEKEMMKAIQQQEKVTWRHRSRGDGYHGPRDDLDYEFEVLTSHLTFDRCGFWDCVGICESMLDPLSSLISCSHQPSCICASI
jgi:hypothetical protein